MRKRVSYDCTILTETALFVDRHAAVQSIDHRSEFQTSTSVRWVLSNSGFDLNLFLSNAWLDSLFPVRLLSFGLAFQSLMRKSFYMTVHFWTANYLGLTLVPWSCSCLSFGSVSAPWTVNYLGLVFILPFEGHFMPNIPGFSPLVGVSSPCPSGLFWREEWNGKLILSIIQAFKLLFNMAPLVFLISSFHIYIV